jgi:hypothetical protein
MTAPTALQAHLVLESTPTFRLILRWTRVKADIVVRLWDDRILPIECKVSNSALNSMKRLNNDAAVKAVAWRLAFGTHQIVPTAVLGGVYNLASLLNAQEKGLSLIWAHDLSPLAQWILSMKPRD